MSVAVIGASESFYILNGAGQSIGFFLTQCSVTE
jgi:hypothetical protein